MPLPRPGGSVFASSSGGGDAQGGAVFGDGAAGDGQAVLVEFFDEFFVAEGVLLVFVVDDFLQLGFDGIPTDAFAVGGFGAAAEELSQGEDAHRRLHVLAGDGSGDGADVDAEDVGDLYHGQGFEMERSAVKEGSLGLQDVVDDA